MRIKFVKGKQREFMKQVLINSNSPSLRSLNQFGLDINYQTLKSYFNENRTLPESLFLDLCRLSGIDKNKLKFKLIEDNWGQKLGSLVSAKVKNKKRQFLKSKGRLATPLKNIKKKIDS